MVVILATIEYVGFDSLGSTMQLPYLILESFVEIDPLNTIKECIFKLMVSELST